MCQTIRGCRHFQAMQAWIHSILWNMVKQVNVLYCSQNYTECGMCRARIARFDSVLAENLDNGVVMQAYPVSSPPFTVAASKYEDQEGLEVGYLQVIVTPA